MYKPLSEATVFLIQVYTQKGKTQRFFLHKNLNTHREDLLYATWRNSLCVCSNSSLSTGQFYSRYCDTSTSRTSSESIFWENDDNLSCDVILDSVHQIVCHHSSYSKAFSLQETLLIVFPWVHNNHIYTTEWKTDAIYLLSWPITGFLLTSFSSIVRLKYMRLYTTAITFFAFRSCHC